MTRQFEGFTFRSMMRGTVHGVRVTYARAAGCTDEQWKEFVSWVTGEIAQRVDPDPDPR